MAMGLSEATHLQLAKTIESTNQANADDKQRNHTFPEKMSEAHEKENVYPVWSSCSFLDSNFYEETASNFEEYRNLALIPERCCLLNDVTYPLDYIDEFYWTPWKSVDYDSGFLLKESTKLEEKLAKLCANVTPLIDNDDALSEEECADSGDLFDTENFKELKLQAPSGSHKFEFLEVPYLPNPALKLKLEITLDELLRNIPRMEVEDVFQNKNILTFDTNFEEENFLENDSVIIDEFESFMGDFEGFKEMDLPKLPDEDINLDHLSVSSEKDDLVMCSKNSEHYNSDSRNLTEKQLNSIQSCQSPHADVTSSADINNLTIYKKFEHDFAYSPIASSDKSAIFDKNDKSEMQLDDESSVSYFKSAMEISDIEESSSDNFIYSDEDRYATKAKSYEEMDDDFSEICNEDFFSENFIDSDDFNDALDNEQFDSVQYNEQNPKNSCPIKSGNKKSFLEKISQHHVTKEVSIKDSFISNGNKKSFLEKLSQLDLAKEVSVDDSFISRDNKINSENSLKSSTVFRNDTYGLNNEQRDKYTLEPTPEDKDSLLGNEIKIEVSQNQGSFSLFSSFLCAKKKENDVVLLLEPKLSNSQASRNSHGEKNESSVKSPNLNSSLDACEGNSSIAHCIESKFQLSEEYISVKLPDDYIRLIQLYESSVTFYVQKLFLWEDFKFSSNLMIVDISLDKTRFLLNQEVKNCRDRNINPLEGGVSYSHYVQLLVFHGILKSLNCLMHFGAQLAISSLYEYEAKHTGMLKGCFQKLIDEVSAFVNNLSEDNSVHPKIKQMSIYLLEKYYFCKDNIIAFKVLIILNEHLNFFYSAFEAYMKTLLPEILIDLIPESDYLGQETDYFSKNEEQICVASASSISKNIHWKNLALLIEYQTDKSVCWKSICKREKVSHIHIRFDSFPLKTLEEIRNLPTLKDPPCKKSMDLKEILIVVSDSVASEYNIKRLCNEQKNISIFVRDYKKYLPDMHFADVSIDYRISIAIIHLTEFSNDCASGNVTEKIFSLQLKYEICWIIIHDDLIYKTLGEECYKKILNAFVKFYFTTIIMKSHHSFKVKFLYTKKTEDVIKYISSILSKNLKCMLLKSDYLFVNTFSSNTTKEEIFLMSFPSFNPFIVSFILSSKTPLFQLMNLKLDDLCKKFHPVPERLLKHFYLLVHETVNLSSSAKDLQETVDKNWVKSDQISRNSDSSFCPKKLSSNTNELIKFITCLEKYHSFEDKLMTDLTIESPVNELENCNTPIPKDYSEMSVEEIDRNYRALKLQDMTSASFDIGFENNFSSSSQSVAQSHSNSTHSISPDSVSPVDNYSMKFAGPSPKRPKCSNSLTSQNDLNNISIEDSKADYLKESKNTKDSHQNLKYPVGSYLPDKCDPSHESKQAFLGDESGNQQNFQVKNMNLSCYKFRKRKTTKSPNHTGSMRSTSSDSISPVDNYSMKFAGPSPKRPKCSNSLTLQNDLNNISIEDSKADYLKESKNTKESYQNLKYPVRSHLPDKCDPSYESKHVFLGDESGNRQNFQVKNMNLSHYKFRKRKTTNSPNHTGSTHSTSSDSASSVCEYSNKFVSPNQKRWKYDDNLISQNDLADISVKESHTDYLNESKNIKDHKQNLEHSMEKCLPNKSNSFEESKHNMQYLTDRNDDPQNFQAKKMNLSQYGFKNKKNIDSEERRFLSHGICSKYSSQNWSGLVTPPSLQKGQSSKTVCKTVSFKNSPIFCVDKNEEFLATCDSLYSSTSSQHQLSKKYDTSSDFSEKSNICSGDIDSPWMSEGKITLTPRTSRKLAIEKIPGMKGQTRLVFH